MLAMNSARIAELLLPYLGGETLTEAQLRHISAHLELLAKWNSRMNLTAVREPEQMVARHFGESLFAGVTLFPAAALAMVADVGSGAGFPGVPIGILRPQLQVTLVESHGKKATFLREVIRSIGSSNVAVFGGRAEECTGTFDVVLMRAVERFEAVLPTASRLVRPGGRLALLVGSRQIEALSQGLGDRFDGKVAREIPGSLSRVLHVSTRTCW